MGEFGVMAVRIPVEVALENLWELLWGNNEKPCKQERRRREGLVGKPAYENGRQAEDPAAVCVAYYWLLEDPCGHVHCRVSWIFIRACMGLPRLLILRLHAPCCTTTNLYSAYLRRRSISLSGAMNT